MKRLWSFVAVVLLVPAVGLNATPRASGAPLQTPPTPRARPSSGATATNQMIVRFVDRESPDATGLEGLDGGGVDLVRQMADGSWVVRLDDRYSPEATERLAESWTQRPDVVFAEPDAKQFPTIVPNDPLYASDQWHYREVIAGSSYGANLPNAWNNTTGSASVVTAVLDTGYTDDPDLAGQVVGGYDLVSTPANANDGGGRDADAHDPGDWITVFESVLDGPFKGCKVKDSSWHGTHVSGTVAAKTDNSVGVAGVGWGTRVVPVRVMGKCGGSLSDIVDGIYWASGYAVGSLPGNPNPANVINMSLGGSGACGASYQNAIDAANAAGALVVVSAGNEAEEVSGHQPANCNNVVSVGASARNGNRADYSNYGLKVDLLAPGGDTFAPVMSTSNSGGQTPVAGAFYEGLSGTSMAAPHVAGVAALMLSLDPTLTPAEMAWYLKGQVTPFPAGSNCSTSTCGTGILNGSWVLTSLVNALYERPRLRVTTDPPVAGRISVDGIHRDTWSLNWAPFVPGERMVCFGPVPGFQAPPCAYPFLVVGQDATVVGEYTPNGYLRVITSPAVASTITVDGVERNDWGLWTEMAPGDHTVCFGAVADLATPACRTVTVTAGATATTTGVFTQSPGAPGPEEPYGYLRVTTDPPVPAMISINSVDANNWGVDWVKVSPGNYFVCFGELPDYQSPESICQVHTVSAGSTTTVTGTYSPKGFLRVWQPGIPVRADILVDGEIANSYGVFTAMPPGSHAVCFRDVPGFTNPGCRDVEVQPLTTAETAAYYYPEDP